METTMTETNNTNVNEDTGDTVSAERLLELVLDGAIGKVELQWAWEALADLSRAEGLIREAEYTLRRTSPLVSKCLATNHEVGRSLSYVGTTSVISGLIDIPHFLNDARASLRTVLEASKTSIQYDYDSFGDTNKYANACVGLSECYWGTEDLEGKLLEKVVELADGQFLQEVETDSD